METNSWVGDLEADGFLEEVTVVHCGVFKNMHTKEVRKFTPNQIDEMLTFLDTVDELIGHNFIKYDLKVLWKLYGYEFSGKVYDTVIQSRILRPFRTLPPNCPDRTLAPHGLGAWGYRVGRGKPDHTDWSVFSEEMLYRCSEDVEINELVYYALQEEMKDGDWSRAVPMTMKLFQVFDRIEDAGWYVDQPWMHYCIRRLTGIIERIDSFLKDELPYVYVVDETKVKGVYGHVKKPFKKNRQYTKNMVDWFLNSSKDSHEAIDREYDREVGGPFCRIHYRRLSLNKRVEVIDMLLDAGWIPDEWNVNDAGEETSPKLSKNDSFTGVDGAFGRHIVRRVQARHRRSNIMGFFKLIRLDGKIGSRISGLAETSRVKHAGIVNIPNTDSFFGTQIRKIFVAEEGKVLVGVDSAGNQVRQLCALMGDDKYEYEVLHGDVHESNRLAAGLPTRGTAKTFFYGFLFGAGDAKTGSIINGTAQDGKAIKQRFLAGLPLLGELVNRLKEEWRANAKTRRGRWGQEYYNGWITGLDGRPIYIKSEHAILVYVLQNMEAIQMSYALLFAYKWLEEKYTWGEDYNIVCFYHDEINTECRPEIAQDVGEIVKKAIIHAGVFLGIKTPHDGDIKIGETWYAIH